MTDKDNGFELKETRWVTELNCNVYIYSHIRTGARLMHIDADDSNKVFTVGFRTPPANHTGVPHILEHSVLCGSEKYPTKEPFVELLKGSLYTFLNAMTSEDYTTYPVASVNDKDFEILMKVYLDAVFFPNMRRIDEIFYQEGWHYELANRDDELTIKGVVYNEMQGYFSAPNEIIKQTMNEALFPSTIYKYNYGGNPKHIPELTLQEFRNFHAKYYHPSNAYIFLYGKMDIANMMGIINNEALKRFTAIEVDSKIPLQPLFTKPIQTECVYAIDQNEDTTDKAWFALDFLLDLKEDPSLKFSFQVITYLLLNTPAAPLKNAYLQAGIGKDIWGNFTNNLQQPRFTLYIKDANPQHKDKVKEIFFNTLNELCKKGIDKQLIEASINIKEFHLREADMHNLPKGFIYIDRALTDWVHDLDPITCLTYEDMLTETKKSLTTNLYEELIEKYIINNPHYAFVTMLPEPGLAEKNHNELKENLRQLKEGMSEGELDLIIATTNKLLTRQATPDSKEELEKIPMLQIEDVGKVAEDFTLTSTNTGGINYLEHDIYTSGIVYLKLYFENKAIPQNLLPYAQLISLLLGKIHTKKYHYAELSNHININTGGIYSSFGIIPDHHNEQDYRLFFTIRAKGLLSKVSKMVELITEIVNNTLFTDAKRLEEILSEAKSDMEMWFMYAGYKFANTRLRAYFHEGSQVEEVIDGVEFYFFLKEILKNFAKKKDEVIQNLQTVYAMLFNKDILYASITSPKEDIEKVKGELKVFTDTLTSYPIKPQKYHFNFCQPNEGFILPGNVQFVSKGYSFAPFGTKYSGDMEVLNQMLDLDYLWNRIRVQGGAYGCALVVMPAGPILASSWSDPNLTESLRVYDETHTYLQELNITDREMVKYKIGAIRAFDTPKPPSLKAEYSDRYFFTNKTQADCQKQRDQLLAADVASIKAYADMLRLVMEKNLFCVFGSEAKIKENSKIFSKVINVFG